MSARAWWVVLSGLWAVAIPQAGLVRHLPSALRGVDLVVVSVLALAYALGPVGGAAVGAWAGLGLDLVPPAAGPVGGWALVLAVVGLGMGAAVSTARPGPFTAMAMVAAGVLAAELGWSAVLWFAGGTPAPAVALAAALAGAAMGVLLAPVALPAALLVAGRPAGSGGRV